MLGNHQTSSHAVFNLKLHLVFVTKYRRKALSQDLLNCIEQSLTKTLHAWRCKMIEFGGEPDHVHLLIEIHPALSISTLVNNLKTTSSSMARQQFSEHLGKFYWKPLFWHGAYFVATVGGATLATVKAYVQSQGTEEHLQKKHNSRFNKRPSLDPTLPSG